MMFRYGVWLLSGILLLAGCESGYKKLPLHEVKTTQTGEGKQSHIESEMFLAYHEVIERSPNVKSVTRITDLKGDREPKYFTISPDGLYLVYQAKEQENSSQYINLWKIATDGGTGTTRLRPLEDILISNLSSVLKVTLFALPATAVQLIPSCGRFEPMVPEESLELPSLMQWIVFLL